MAKAKPKKSKGALGRAASLLASIPAVGNVRNAAKKVGKATKTIKKSVKKATKTVKKVAKSAKKKVKKTVKKKKKKASKLKKVLKKAKKKVKRKVKKKLKKKVGKVFTKARKLKNNLSKNKRVQKLKKKMKKTVLKAKKGIKKVKKTVKKTSKAVIKNSKKIMKKTVLVAKSFAGGGFNVREAISTAADMIPIVGNAKSFYEAVVGKDPITGRKLGKTERAMAGISTFLGGGTKVLTRGGNKVVSSLISGGKKPTGKLTVPKGTGSGNKKTSQPRTAEQIISDRTKGLDLKPHPIQQKQLSAKKTKELRAKIENRTITKAEYDQYIWNKKFAKRRASGVTDFWNQERQRILNNETPTRGWNQEQLNDILNGKKPKIDGKTVQGHHSYSASQYPHLANKGEIIYPATPEEHFKGWHGGNWKNSLPGKPINPIDDF